MYFKSLTITNLFSYYGSCLFELTPPVHSEQNIIIIQGRNGDGKTSFLKSVKMLFAGITEEIRRTAQRKRIPSPKQYICGIPNELWGIANQQAKLESTGNIISCSVQAIWESDEGEVKAERTWEIDYLKNDYEENINVSTPFQGVLKGKEAEDYLERCLPRSYMPFFFFDGEEVQELAEANDNDVIAKMEQLLNIRPLENLQDRLKELSRDWRLNSMSIEKRNELTNKENTQRLRETEFSNIEEKLQSLDNDTQETEEQLNKIARQLRVLRGNNEEGESAIKERKKLKDEQRQALMAEISECFQRDAFLRLTPELTEKALKSTEILQKQEQGSQLEMINSLKKELPEIFTRPPYPSPRLESQQVDFYQKRIVRALEYYDIPETNGAVFKIDGSRVRQLTELLSNFRELHKPHKVLKRKIYDSYNLKQELIKLEFQLKDAGELSDKQRAEFSRLIDEDDIYKEKLLTLKDDYRTLETQKRNIQNELTSLNKELSNLNDSVRKASDVDQQSKFADHLIDALKEVKKRLKQQKQVELEETYNRHLKQLLDSNSLIAAVKINEHFEITYLDVQNNVIGMSTISAGMKQLSATALLWGLKEISAREIPLIIDTPMGRIDRQHQNNLLQKYYPKIGRQVILLPTDSELDTHKYALLKPFIYREFHLSNTSGKHTHVERIL